ncbi:MAG: hydroxypyruvate isomerase [Verrucomicrobia bacterium]|nr:hydroxypyruvate isomerase [Verrucomicrobiota bacterium]
MPKFAANLTMLFTEVPFLERFALARQAGFDFVEYLFPYAFPAEELQGRLRGHSLQQVLFNLPAGDWAAGDRGLGASPGREGEFREGVARAIEYARTLGVPRLNCLAGKRVPGRSDAEHWQVLVENVRFAADALRPLGLELLVEAINHFDIPGFFLNRTEQVARLLDEAGRANVRIQYDLYHAQREEGELTATLRRHFARIGHIQIADNPGRHQPGTGEINFPFVFRQLDELGYPGFVGLEYVPTPDTGGSLGWLREFGSKA